MTKKARKPINEDPELAQGFVFGSNDSSPPPEPQAEASPTPSPRKRTPQQKMTPQETQSSSLLERLRSQPKEPTVRFTVDLSESLHQKLSLLAVQTRRSKADIVRELLNSALDEIMQ